MSTAKRPAETGTPIHDLISHRWSPRAFDRRPVEPEKLRSLFEAARWAASSYNAQPWYFIVGTKDDPENYKRVLESLVEFNQGWAKQAPVLALSVAKLKFDDGRIDMHSTTWDKQPRIWPYKQKRWDFPCTKWRESMRKKRGSFSIFPRTMKPWQDLRSAIPEIRSRCRRNCASAK